MNNKNIKLVMLIVVIALALVLTLVFTCKKPTKRKGNKPEHTNAEAEAETETDTGAHPRTHPHLRVHIHSRIWYEGSAYIIGGVESGGSKKFIEDLQTHFPQLQHVKTLERLRLCDFGANDVLFLQHLWNDIRILDVLSVVQRSHCHLFVNVHDWTYISSPDSAKVATSFNVILHSSYLAAAKTTATETAVTTVTVAPVVKALFADAVRVLHPSQFTRDVFSRFFSNTRNFLVTPHIDELVRVGVTGSGHIPSIHKSVINIGVLHQPSEYKGAELIQALQKAVSAYRGFTVAFKIVGVNIPLYADTQAGFAECCAQHRIHGLTLLNKWGETYCYALTKFLNSGLPILYNSYGAVKERMPAAGPYFKLFDTEAEFRATEDVAAHAALHRFLDYIITHAETRARNPTQTQMQMQMQMQPAPSHPVVVPPFYSFVLRDDMHVADVWRQVHARVHPYCFYVPNRLLSDTKDRDAPCMRALQLSASTSWYDNDNGATARRQIALAAHWGVRGFCLRMQPCDAQALFLTAPFPVAAPDFKVFFSLDLLAAALPASATLLETLATCFRHPNYLKVNGNKPVLHLQTVAGLRKPPPTAAYMKQREAELAFVAALHAAGFDVVCVGDFLDAAAAHFSGVGVIEAGGTVYDLSAATAKAIREHTSMSTNDVKVEVDVPFPPSSAAGTADIDAELYKMLLVDSWNDWENGTAIEPSTSMGHGRVKTLKLALIKVL